MTLRFLFLLLVLLVGTRVYRHMFDVFGTDMDADDDTLTFKITGNASRIYFR